VVRHLTLDQLWWIQAAVTAVAVIAFVLFILTLTGVIHP
jgi:hypothetical protein